MRSLKSGAGKLTHRVTIQQRRENPTSGASDPYYEDISTVWASIEALSGRELFLAQQVQSTTDHMIRMRFNKTLEPKHRLYYYDSRRDKHRYFNINRIADDSDGGTYIDVYVTEWNEAPTGQGAVNA